MSDRSISVERQNALCPVPEYILSSDGIPREPDSGTVRTVGSRRVFQVFYRLVNDRITVKY